MSNNSRFLSLLIGHKKFQTFVKDVRNFLQIPIEGFMSDDQIRKWAEESHAKDEEYLNSDGYKAHNINIRKKIKLGEMDIGMANKHLHLLDQKLRVNYLTNHCKYILEKFNLPTSLEHAIRIYILWNKFDFVSRDNFAFIYDPKNKDSVRIEVYSRLTKEEEKSLLKLVKSLTKNFPKIGKISETTMQQLEFEDWYKNRNKYSERITAKDIAEECLGSRKKLQKIYDTPRELKRKREKLFGKSGS